MKSNYKILFGLILALWSAVLKEAYTQPYPGGVSSGTVRGYKVDYYNGSFANVSTAFGVGTANATPGNFGYTNKVTGNEFINLDATNFGLEYTGILNIPVTGVYTFQMESIDDEATLYIDGVLLANGIYSGSAPNAGYSGPFTAGDHTIKIKFRNGGGPGNMSLKLIAAPAGSNITVPTDVDGRFVRYEGAKLTAWYKADNLIINGTKVNTWTNMAPDYAGNGNMNYGSGGGAQSNINTMVNFNPGVRFDGDDIFTAANSQKGLSFRGATKSMFLVNNYISNVNQSGTWMFYHYNGSANGTIGFYKGSGNTQIATSGGSVSLTTTYTAYEPKLMAGFVDQVTGGTAPSGTNPLSIDINGGTRNTTSLVSGVTAHSNYGLCFGNSSSYMSTNFIPEAIYFPFMLSTQQEQQVSTYLAVKYGISMTDLDYVSTNGTIIFDNATSGINVGYRNRIFGIGRELAAQGLHQKQSQSQMTSKLGYDFMIVSKGTIISTTNATNNGTLPENSYLLLGDNNGTLTPQVGEIPVSYISSCTINRLGREWKAQSTGNPGAVTIQAGSSTAGSFLFPGNASGLKLVIDGDGDGNFETGSGMQTLHDPVSVINGVATFSNIIIPNGAVITFAWAVTSPGGVSNGLALWLRGDAGTSTTTHNTTTTTWNDLSNALTLTGSGTYRNDTSGNFNPYISFNGSGNYFAAPAGFANFTTGVSSFFVSNLTNTSQNFSRFFDFGNGAPNNNLIFSKSGTSANLHVNSYNATSGGGIATTSAPISVGVNQIYSFIMPGGTVGSAVSPVIYADGAAQSVGTSSAVVSGNVTRNNNYIGRSNWAGDSYFNGSMSEGIIYNTALSAAEQLRINSYLAIKYGRTLPNTLTNYIASNGSTIIWNNATYWNNVFGIGRDDCSGLIQKQSKSTSVGDNVTIGLATIVGTNAANSGIFANNLQFIVIGNDGGALSSTTSNVPVAYNSCNPVRYARNWLVKNTNNVNNSLQLKVGNNTFPIAGNWSNITLAVSTTGDNTFATGVSLYPATNINNGVATFNNVSLPDGAVFTVCYTVGYPGGVSKPTAGTLIDGQTYINGLEYKLYTTNGTAGSIAAGFGAYSPTLLSTGYYNNATSFHAFVTNKIATNFGVELTGKLYIPATSATYRFSGTGDDQFALIIDGNVLLNINGSPYTATTGDIFLTAGYHDIIIRGREQSGSENFNLTWNGGSGGTYSAIPDTNFFVSPKGPSAWYMADDNDLANTFAEGATVNNWKDLSNGNNLTEIGSNNPTFYNSNKSFIANYNPTVYFTADYIGTSNYLNGFAYGSQGKSVFAVGSNNNTGGETIYTGYGIDATNGNFGITKLSTGKLQLFGSSNTLTEAGTFYSTAAITTDIISGYHSNGNIAGVGINTYLYANGLEKASASKPAWNTLLNDNGQIFIGAAPDYSNTYWYNKNINEIIYYPWDLTATERLKINSYLAIKWGITLDQTSPTNYLASDGTILWSSTTAGSYKNDITVIGRDDCSALHQKQSTSTDQADIISMAHISHATTNAANLNSFVSDKTFISFAHNGQAVKGINSNLLPVSLSASVCYVKLDRVWQTQTKGSPGTASLELGSAKDFSVNRATYKPVLLVSNSGTDFTAAIIIQADSVNRGKAYFSNVDFGTNATKYFTLAYINAAPGGVVSNLTAWYDAGADVFTDDELTVYAENSGDLVAGINNVAFGSTLPSLYQSSGSLKPIYNNSKFNYNPALIFDGSNDGLFSTSNSISSNAYRNTNTITSIVAAANSGTTANNQFVFWMHINSNVANGKNGMELNQAYFQSSSNPLSRSPIVTVPELFSMRYTATAGWNNYRNLLSVGSGTSNITGTTTGPFTIGSYKTSYSGGLTYAGKFDMGEIIIYKDDKGSATTTPMRKIHSYLAIKYGYTLDATAMGGAYLASDSTVTYHHTGYWNRITGVGRDDCSALEQRQSLSQETGALVKLSNDPDGMAISNILNPVSFTQNMTFMVFGDDNGELTWTDEDEITDNDISIVRLKRTWRIKETGTVGTVYLEVPDNSGSGTTLPAENTTVYLLVSDSPDFSNPVAVSEMTLNGTNWSGTYNFTDGQYYTFGTMTTCLAPAGVSLGLTTWYKADDKTLGALSNLNDETGKINLVKYGTDAANIVAATPSNNYNRYLQLVSGTSNGSSFASSAANQPSTALTSTTSGTMYGITFSTAKDRLFTVARSGYNTLGMTGTTNNPGLNNTTLTAAYPAGITGAANIWGMKWDGTTVSPYTNGVLGSTQSYSTALTANSTHYVGIGGSYNGTTYTRSGIAFNEAFSYNRALSVAEEQKINTYLALKYGQTLTHNYVAPGYDGTNAVTTTLYDVSTHGNRVLGVGRHTAGCFVQNQSNSVLPGGMLKVSVDDAITTENSRDLTKWIVDRTYVILGDNNASIVSWSLNNIPALYTGEATSCAEVRRIDRQWKYTSTNFSNELLVAIPSSASSATTKLPVVPVGFGDVYMVISPNADFTIESDQVEMKMTLNGTSNDWEARIPMSAGETKYFTFIIKSLSDKLMPILVANGVEEGKVDSCFTQDGYIYYTGNIHTDRAIISVKPNSNEWAPAMVKVNNVGSYSNADASSTFINGYYQATDGLNVTRISRRMHTIKHPGEFSINGGITVRVYYDPAEFGPMVSDPAPGEPVNKFGWMKHRAHQADSVVHFLTPLYISGEELIPDTTGVEEGISYAEFKLNSFSTILYYASSNPSVLPVEMEYFNVAAQSLDAVLSWKTASELNNDRFEIERSRDALSFSKVGSVKGHGTSSAPNLYTFTDVEPGSGLFYYRLKQVDFDGTTSYSPIRSVTFGNKSSLRIYPNPSDNMLFVDSGEPIELVQIRDIQGRLIIEKRNLTEGISSFDISSLSSGTYLISIVSKEISQTRRIVKQ